MQTGVAFARIARHINRKRVVPSYFTEVKYLMYLGGGKYLYMNSQWMSVGDVEVVKTSRQVEISKTRFEKLFFRLRGNIGELHRRMIK